MKTELGDRLRQHRQDQGVSLRTLAAAVGISPSMLSQVETGKIHPSVTTLYSLASYLDVSLDDLLGFTPTSRLAPAAQSPEIQRHEENPVLEMEGGVIWERLATAGRTGVDPLLVTYSPGAASSVDGKMMRHSGVEYGYILAGELTIQLDFERWTLRAGDSFCFESHRPHLYRNETSVPAKGVWFVVGRANDAQAERAELAAAIQEPAMIRSASDVLDAFNHRVVKR
ncbi:MULTISPECIES: cupin domain-containing protein [Paenarthrobacter]|uniref:Helix-turn-helix domain-containing protein n=1 Tax=Paenarthrobacter ureafaciens TaxID=37931 RepID=A0AAX3EPW6_PAEUR|nr:MULTISPECIES: cupin domain-containing protein [Paenarthrobacter]MDO5878302.1 helix-turn-helix domain-containing protein [Paenarthrobacter sp. SD-1]UYW00177.1 helix-turn-helix domain-containing protein [Paenarthrobacter ureafaciens]WIV33625.1 helix-turn-helix domain-containing protein [Paenarthrobacter sp. R1]